MPHRADPVGCLPAQDTQDTPSTQEEGSNSAKAGFGIPLGALLAVPPLNRASILAGADGLDRPVTGVNVLEAPDIANWLGGHDLVITTGYALRETPHAFGNIIRELNEGQASGLGVKLNRFLNTLPEEAISLANELHFPLLSIPYDVKWIEIIEQVTSRLLRHQADLLERAEAVHRQLCDLLLSHCSLTDIVGRFAEIVGRRAALLSANGHPLAVSTAFPPTEIAILKNQVCAHQAAARSESPAPASMATPAGSYTCLPVAIGTAKPSAFLIFEQAEDYLSNYVARSVATLISLQIQRMQTLQQIKTKVRDDFLRDLLDGSLRAFPADSLHRRVRALGWDLREGIAAIAIAIPGLTEITVGLEGEDEQIQLYFEQIRSILSPLGKEPVVVSGGHAIILATPQGNERPEQTVSHTARLALTRLQEQLGLCCAAGVGSLCDLAEAHKSYAEAREALRIGSRLKGPGHITLYSELGVYRVLRTEDKVAAKFCSEYLGPLLQYDEKHHTELLKTLSTYFAQGCDPRRTAKSLFVHYQTVRYRLGQAFKILGIDQSDPEALLNLRVALKIMATWGNEECDTGTRSLPPRRPD